MTLRTLTGIDDTNGTSDNRHSRAEVVGLMTIMRRGMPDYINSRVLTISRVRQLLGQLRPTQSAPVWLSSAVKYWTPFTQQLPEREQTDPRITLRRSHASCTHQAWVRTCSTNGTNDTNDTNDTNYTIYIHHTNDTIHINDTNGTIYIHDTKDTFRRIQGDEITVILVVQLCDGADGAHGADGAVTHMSISLQPTWFGRHYQHHHPAPSLLQPPRLMFLCEMPLCLMLLGVVLAVRTPRLLLWHPPLEFLPMLSI